MNDPWLQPVEKILLASDTKKSRVLGFTGPEADSGISMLSAIIAESFAGADIKTLLIDMTAAVLEQDDKPGWFPGRKNAAKLVEVDPRGFDLLVAEPTDNTRFMFNNVERIQQTLDEELASYAKIVLDLPPVLQGSSNMINPVASAAACGAVFLVCATGRIDRPRLMEAQAVLTSADVGVSGIILNDFIHQTTGAGIARSAKRILRFAPGLAGWIERKALSANILN